VRRRHISTAERMKCKWVRSFAYIRPGDTIMVRTFVKRLVISDYRSNRMKWGNKKKNLLYIIHARPTTRPVVIVIIK